METAIIEVMLSYNEYIEKVKEGCLNIALFLRDGEEDIAMKEIINFTGGVDWIEQVNTKLQKLGYINEVNFPEISGFLNEINEGIEKTDFLLVADIFEYEVKPFFENLTPYLI